MEKTRENRPFASLRVASLPFAGLPLLALLSACSTGGEEDRPVSEILISASHHMFGLGGDQGFPEFPVPQSKIGTDRGLFTMTDTGGYTVARGGQTTAPAENYNLQKGGELSLSVPVPRSAPTRFIGAYQQTSQGNLTQVYYFTDRFAPTSAPTVGFFWGTRTVAAAANPEGDWFLFSQHVIFSKSSVLNPHEVGRAATGLLSITKAFVVSGAGEESSGSTLAFSGKAETFKPDDGALIVTLDYKIKTTSDSRTFRCGQAKDVILGVDEDETTGETGLIAMVRKFAISDRTAAQVKLAGTYLFGLQTIFVAPTNSGIDAANGTITFNDKGGWLLDGVGSQGPVEGKFSYSGSYEFEQEGTGHRNRMLLRVNGTNETWYAAFDPEYKVIVLLDDEVENRTAGISPELNILLAVKEEK